MEETLEEVLAILFVTCLLFAVASLWAGLIICLIRRYQEDVRPRGRKTLLQHQPSHCVWVRPDTQPLCSYWQMVGQGNDVDGLTDTARAMYPITVFDLIVLPSGEKPT